MIDFKARRTGKTVTRMPMHSVSCVKSVSASATSGSGRRMERTTPTSELRELIDEDPMAFLEGAEFKFERHW